MRIDKVLSNMGYGSRKDVKKLLKSGYVRVGEDVVKDAKLHVDVEQDEIWVGEEQVVYREYVYLMMNKPQGVISATEDNNHETVIDILEEKHRIFEPFPVGRLDIDTEGLLLITNDGHLTHNLLSPKKHVKKTYYAEIYGVVTEADVKAFAKGVTLEDGYETMPAELEIIHTDDTHSQIEVTIMEGKFHQVKRMFEAVEKKVIYLQRVKMGPLELDETLELGEYRELTEEELEALMNANKE